MKSFHTQILTIEGMDREESVHGVTHALGEVPSVRIDKVEPGRARVLAEPASEPPIRKALENAGFTLSSTEVEE